MDTNTGLAVVVDLEYDYGAIDSLIPAGAAERMRNVADEVGYDLLFESYGSPEAAAFLASNPNPDPMRRWAALGMLFDTTVEDIGPETVTAVTDKFGDLVRRDPFAAVDPSLVDIILAVLGAERHDVGTAYNRAYIERLLAEWVD